MKKKETPIPLRSVICLPRWLMLGGVALSGGCMLAGLGLAIYAFAAAPTSNRAGWYGGLLGGAFGCLIGGAGGLFGTLADWGRRYPAPLLFAQLQNNQPTQFYRRVFWPALLVTLLALAIGCTFGHWHILQGFLQTGAILSLMSGSMEAMRRHTTKQARAVFALYADGVLEPADAAAIDDARSKDPKFDAAVREFQRVAAQLRELGSGPTVGSLE